MSAPEGSPPQQTSRPQPQTTSPQQTTSSQRSGPPKQPAKPRPAGSSKSNGATTGSARRSPASSDVGLPSGVWAADLVPRLTAGLVDALPWIVLGLLQIVVSQAEVPHWLTITIVILDVAWLAFLGWQCTSFAATPGLRMTRLQLVAMSDGRTLTWGAWLVRALVLAALGATVVGWIVMAVLMRVQPRRQSLPDLVVGSIMIRQRAVAPRRQTAATRPADTPIAATRQSPRPRPVPVAAGPTAAPYQSPVPYPAAAVSPGSNGSNGSDSSNGSNGAAAPASRAEDRIAAEVAAPIGSFFDTERPAPQYGPHARGQQRETSGRAMSYPTAADPRPYPGYGLPLAFEQALGLPASAPTASDPVAPGTTKQWQLTLDGEHPIEPAALTLFGRNPQRAEGETGVAVVKVRDEARTVSKTHVAVGLDSDGLFAIDRGSTNGSAVTTLVGDYKLLKAGERVPLAEGSTVAFGEHRLVATLVDRPPLAD